MGDAVQARSERQRLPDQEDTTMPTDVMERAPEAPTAGQVAARTADLAQDFLRLLRQHVPGTAAALMKGGFGAGLSSFGRAAQGLVAGSTVGLLLGLVAVRVVSVLSPGGAWLAAGKVALVLHYLVVAALGGAVIGWWRGVRGGLKKAIGSSQLPSHLVGAVADVAFRFVEAHGLSPARQEAVLAELHEALADLGSKPVRPAGMAGRIPLVSGLAASASEGIRHRLVAVPEAILQRAGLAPERTGEVKQCVTDAVTRELRERLCEVADRMVQRPLLLTYGLAAALLAAPPVALLAAWLSP
jgi:hypothetical protein